MIYFRGLTFREPYRKLPEFCCVVDAPLLFLTATATRTIQEDILDTFSLPKDIAVVASIPDRWADIYSSHVSILTVNLKKINSMFLNDIIIIM